MSEPEQDQDEYVLNPITRRRVKVGSTIHKRLVKAGHIKADDRDVRDTPPPAQERKCKSLKPLPESKQKGGRKKVEIKEPEESDEPEDEPEVDNEDFNVDQFMLSFIDLVISNRAILADKSITDAQIKQALSDALS